jgi:energy-coupling factor transport system substrate-specific component
VKKSTAALIALAVFIASWVTGQVLDFPVTDNLALMTLIAVGLVLAFYYLRFEEKRADAKLIAMIGSLTALSVAGRVLFAAIPSVQPCTFIIIVSGYVFGPMSGFMVGATTALVSNIFLGHGPWTLWQMLAWGVAGLTSGLFGRRRMLENRWGLSVYSAAWGLLYGWLVNAYFVLGFVHPVTLGSFVASYGAALWFDLLHAAGNFAFAFALGPGLVKMLDRYRSRFAFDWEPGAVAVDDPSIPPAGDAAELVK